LRGSPQGLAPVLGTDIAPPRRSQADGRSLNRRRRQLSARKIQYFNRQIEQGLGWETRLAHHAFEARGASDAEQSGQLGC
jgi:hypothetical protein